MIREIGSEFWTGCTPVNGSGVAQLLPAGMELHYTLCGRTALELVLRDALQFGKIRKAYLPSYCCHTMIEPFTAKGIEVDFYSVYFTDTGIDYAFCEDNDCDLVFLMDYFGFWEEKTARIAKNQKACGKCVVYDATHSLFCEGIDYSHCDYVFGSFRKWFGVNAGFCAKQGSWLAFPELTQNNAYTQKRNTAFEDKMQFMDGMPMEKRQFLDAFSQAEESLETDYMGYAPDAASMQTLQKVNVAMLREKRRENAAYAIARINAMGCAAVYSPYRTVRAGDCPMFVPILVPKGQRDALRRFLIDRQIYCPVHWPVSEYHRLDERSGALYAQELSLVCDQRYTPQDMDRIIDAVKEFWKR